MTAVQSIDRATAILRVLATADPSMRLTEVAAEAGLSLTTTHRLLASLAENGLCERDSDGMYRLGLMLLELGTRVQAGLDLRERSRPWLERLADQTHLTSFLCVRRDDRAVCLERVAGRDAFTLALEAGGSLPLYVGGAPRVLLAYDSQEGIRAYLDARMPLPSLTANTATDPASIVADLADSRTRGWVISDEDVTLAVAAIGAPVFGAADQTRPVAAVSVGGLRPHVLGAERDSIIAALLETANAIGAALGAPQRDDDEDCRPCPRAKAA